LLEEVNMEFRYQSEAVSPQGLDDLINEKSRIGWELHGVYSERSDRSNSESSDRSKYRVLFKVPCEELELMASFAREKNRGAEQKRVAEALLKDLRGLGVPGFQVGKLGEGEGELSVTFGESASAEVKVQESGIWVGKDKRNGKNLAFAAASGLFFPEKGKESEGTKNLASKTALAVLVAEILEAMK
jgi:hypothetical protein